MMAHADYKEMLLAHALSALDASEAQALNEHLAGCPRPEGIGGLGEDCFGPGVGCGADGAVGGCSAADHGCGS